MASLNKTGGGKTPGRAIQFVQNGRRRTIRLGKIGLPGAREFKSKVEALLAAKITNIPPDAQLSSWLAGLSDKIHAKLAKVDLIDPRTPPPTAPRLGPWLARYVKQRTDWKPNTRKSTQQTERYLREYFGDDRCLDQITVGDAADWRAWMAGRGFAEASLRSHARNAKTLFNAAVEYEVIPRNPFRKLAATAIAAELDRYVTPDEADTILEACPDVHWRTLFGLARFAGLRCPSETHILTWGDVDWDRGRLRVASPKTEHHERHRQRMVPITPRLMQLLQDSYDAAEDGQERVCGLSAKNRHRPMLKILERAGIEPWKDCFQALRRSCETEWSEHFPQHAVSTWLGHGERISRKHYLMVPDELWNRAAGLGAAESAAASSRIKSQGVAKGEGANRLTGNEKPMNIGLNGQKGGLSAVGARSSGHASKASDIRRGSDRNALPDNELRCTDNAAMDQSAAESAAVEAWLLACPVDLTVDQVRQISQAVYQDTRQGV